MPTAPTFPRLPITQQRNVGHALEAHFNAQPKPSYAPQVMQSGEALIAATGVLGDPAGPTLFVIDGATDSIIAAILRIAQSYVKAFSRTVVSPSDEQQAQLDAAKLVITAWFPDGIGFIHGSPSHQNDVMTSMRKDLQDPETGAELQAAIKTLGLGPLVDYFIAHTRVYARKLGLSGEVVSDADAEPADPSDAWHEAFCQFAIDVNSFYRKEPAVIQTLLGGYDSQLAEYRAEQAKERKKAAKAEAEAKAKAEADAKAKAEAEAKDKPIK